MGISSQVFFANGRAAGRPNEAATAFAGIGVEKLCTRTLENFCQSCIYRDAASAAFVVELGIVGTKGVHMLARTASPMGVITGRSATILWFDVMS